MKIRKVNEVNGKPFDKVTNCSNGKQGDGNVLGSNETGTHSPRILNRGFKDTLAAYGERDIGGRGIDVDLGGMSVNLLDSVSDLVDGDTR